MIKQSRLALCHSIILILLVLALGPTPAHAAGPDRMDPAELEAFLDAQIKAQMDEHHIPGAMISVVNDGEVVLAKGYGYSDVDQGVAVDPERSMFRIGSLSKLFTWTAVMQLVERGELDLNADIGQWLDFEIPATYPEPITMAHLMSHTAGFEESSYQMLASSSDRSVPLGEWLATHIPARVRRPGEIAAYSNYGTALAGYIVERITGTPWEGVVQERILDPLGMAHTTAYQPVPANTLPNLAVGYAYADGAQVAQAFEHFEVGPAGSVSASATDMAQFMLAHLQEGEHDGVRILDAATTREMHTTLFTHDARLSGIAHGFIEGRHGEQRTLWHGGSTNFFKSNLILLPELGVGMFISGNGAGADSLRHAVPHAFLDRFYPSQAPVAPVLADIDLRPYCGSYRLTRSSYTKLEKARYILESFEIAADADGYLTFGGQRYAPIGDLLFAQVDGTDRLAFREDAQGRITHAYIENRPIWAYERRTGVDAADFQLALALPSLALFLITLLVWPIAGLIKRRRGHPPSRAERTARWVSVIMMLLNAATLIGAVLGMPSPLDLMRGAVASLVILPALATLAALMALVSIATTFMAWQGGHWTTAGRIHYALVTVAGLVFVWWFNYWNLIGWRL